MSRGLSTFGRTATALACALALALPIAARAQFATGGVGIYRNNIVWLAWGANNDRVGTSATRTNVIPVGGQFLRTTCTYSGANGGMSVRTPNGRGLGALYNDTGIGATSTMPIGLYGDNATLRTFNLMCSATFGPTGTAADPPFHIDGLVVSDAEQNAASDEYEEGAAAAGATWRIIERYRPTGCTFSSSAVAVNAQTLRLEGAGAAGTNSYCNPTVAGEGQGPMAIGFLEGASAASFTLKGRGISGIALGVFVNVADLSDAPASYGVAQHLPQFTWSGGTVTGTQAVNDPAFVLAVKSPAATIQFGARTDTELVDPASDTAAGDDATGIDDEDAVSGTPTFVLGTGPYSLADVPCTGANAAVRAFVDFNRDGDFLDGGEASTPTTCVAGHTTLTWTPPADARGGATFLRLRIAANAVEVANPAGTAGAGEVEDHPLLVVPARITLVKRLVGRMRATDQFTVSIETPTPAAATTTGSDLHGTTTATTARTTVDAGRPLVLRDALSAGTGVFADYTRSIACVANAGSTGALPAPSGPVVAGTSADFSITPNLGNDLTCTITNQAPAATFAIGKSLTGESGSTAGRAEASEQLTYTISVANTSATDALGVRIVDAIPAHTTFVSASHGGAVTGGEVRWSIDLAAGDSVPLTVVFQVASPVPPGGTLITNNATADDPDDANPPTACSTVPCASTPVAAVPSLAIDKQVLSGAPYAAVGTVVEYTYLVTNTGNVAIDAVSVSDDRIANVACADTSLAAGGSTTCSANYTITQADLDAGAVTNTATASGTPTDGTLAPATDSATAQAAAQPALTLAKSAIAGDPYDAVGDVVDYEYVVTNTGNVRIDALQVTDDRIADVRCSATTLAPAQRTTCTARGTITQADLDAGTLTNTATATGTPAQGTLLPATDSATVTATAQPAIALDKRIVSGNPYDAANDEVGYDFVVTNTGNLTLDNLSISDDRIGTVPCAVATLAPRASTTCSATYAIVQGDVDAGTVTNTAIARAVASNGAPVSATDSATAASSATPLLQIDKSVAAGTTYDSVGDVLQYTYRVTNPSQVTINAVTVADDRIAEVACDETTLDPGQSTTCRGTYVVTQADLDARAVTNIATVQGTAPSGPVVPDTDTLTVDSSAAASMTLEKSATTAGFANVGETVDYEYLVTNTGPVTIQGLRVGDDRIANVACPVTTLAPGAQATCTARYTITQDDLDAGSVTNHASATSTTPLANPPTDSAVVVGEPAPAWTLEKSPVSAGPYDRVGAVIDYRYVITNTGNVTIHNLQLADDRIGTVACPTATLARFASVTCLASYTLTEADLDAGSVTNHATATGAVQSGVLPPAEDDATVDLAQAPALALEKTVVRGNPYQAVGDIVEYQYLVTNAGNVTITQLAVSDDHIADVQCPVATLAAQAATICTGRYAITQMDLDAGSVTNIASVQGVAPSGAVPPATDDATVTATASPSMTLDKSAVTAQPFRAAGDVIHYRYVVANTGNVTIDALRVTDDKIADVQCPTPTLAPGATMTCTARYNVTARDVGDSVVTNIATATGTPASGTLSAVTDSATVHMDTRVTYAKLVETTGPVAAGDLVAFRLTATVTGGATTAATTLTDTFGTGLRLHAVTDAGPFDCNATQPLECTLPRGTARGTYAITYTATVGNDATRVVRNSVAGTSDGAQPPTCDGTCTTATPVREPSVVVTKSANPAEDTEVVVGQVITYTLTVAVRDAATLGAVVLRDRPDAGLTFAPPPSGCVRDLPHLVCTLPAGTPAGVYTFVYEATVNGQADALVSNTVTAENPRGRTPPECIDCALEHPLAATQLRLSKTVAVREAKVGDLVRYTLTLENTGAGVLNNGMIEDRPPPGFTYVQDSLRVRDRDNLGTIEGASPLRIAGLDIEAGKAATVTYLLRVGAGVRPGRHANQAQAFSTTTQSPISNTATAEVDVASDPLLEDSLVFGTVFDDRDGDGWQDSAALHEVRVQGGFAPAAYVANSTTIDRGEGPRPEADASAPLLHGIALGTIPARESAADPPARIVIRQRLHAPGFTDDFAISNAEGLAIRMDAAGTQSVDRHGDAADGLTAADITVERRVTQGQGDVVVDYVITNLGIDERGIPGVRIAAVEGLLVETDLFGRFHLAGMSGGTEVFGRNFLLKADPATLPPGAVFTTANPLLRRITPGLPVRFDWGVRMPAR